MIRSTHRLVLTCLTLVALFASSASAQSPAPSWRAGVAEVSITPAASMWMSGYGGRTAPAEGTQDELMAKAVILEAPDAKGTGKSQVVLITLDLVGIGRSTSLTLCDRLNKKFGFERRQI